MRPEDLDQQWKIENIRRSLAMLPSGAPGLSRDDSMLVLELLAEARGREDALHQPEDGG
jgi:hypothetical protein